MISSIQIPATLHPSRSRAVVLLLLCLVIVVGSIWTVRNGWPMGYFCGGLSSLCLPVFALQFHPMAAYLHLEADGFTYCSLFRPRSVRWDEIRGFAVVRVGVFRLPAWNFTPNCPAA